MDAGFSNGGLDGETIFPRKSEGFLDDEMLASASCGDGMGGVKLWIAANGDYMDRWVGEHFLQSGVKLDGGSMLGRQFLRVERAA